MNNNNKTTDSLPEEQSKNKSIQGKLFGNSSVLTCFRRQGGCKFFIGTLNNWIFMDPNGNNPARTAKTSKTYPRLFSFQFCDQTIRVQMASWESCQSSAQILSNQRNILFNKTQKNSHVYELLITVRWQNYANITDPKMINNSLTKDVE